MFGTKLRDNLFTRPSEDAKKSFAAIWAVIGTALQSDTATFPKTADIRALVGFRAPTTALALFFLHRLRMPTWQGKPSPTPPFAPRSS